MKVEPIHQLAVALHSAPRLFACVLGSGVSCSAGIQTGWQMLLDLVARHAAQLGEHEAAAKDPALWYAQRFGGEPDYSDVVQALAPTTELRRNLLEPYFTVADPVTRERREHEPSPAHHAIARLVRRGLVRVIVTTNFDRLMENALREAGVAQVEVVSSEEEAANCYPFHASECFVFKVHGDWKDTRLRNSRAELADYPRPIANLLRRILGEHGLIVCGWSAEYDVALRQAVARYQRRFPVYWVDPKPGAAAERLVEHLRGTQVAALGDRFFDELELAVAALDRSRPPPPLSAEVLVARARRLISDEGEMGLDDLVQDATRGLCQWIEQGFEPTYDPSLAGADLSRRAQEVATLCEQQAAPLASLLTTLARYKQASYLAERSLSALLRSAETRATPMRAANEGWWWYFSYPALLCAYAHGVARGHQDDWRAAIAPVRDAGSGGTARELRLPPEQQADFYVPMYANVPGPNPLLRFGHRIADWLFPLTRGWIPRSVDFQRTFDRFDLLLCALTLRPQASEWKPRCSVPRDPNEPPSARLSFDEVAEHWLLPRVLRAESTLENEPLIEAFTEVDLTEAQVVDRLRAWGPAP